MLQETSGLWYSAEYWSFAIDDEANKYRLHGDGYSGDAGDGLHVTDGGYYMTDGMSFSTYDQDNDNWYGASCAASYSAGFWYNNCYWWCLTCEPSRNWDWWSQGEEHSVLSASRMMIKPQY